MRIAIGVPVPSHVPVPFLISMTSIVSYTTSHLNESDELFVSYQEGVRTDKNRNIILQRALEADCDYILWLDADMMYPRDIVFQYLKHPFDIIGCLYFKRSTPYMPVAYLKNNNPVKPYSNVDVAKLPENTIVEVDGLGFGGMMVDMRVYKAMGEDKWMKYTDNYHLPYEDEGQLTHDLNFCRIAKDTYGFSIRLHTGITTGHLGDEVITRQTYERTRDMKDKTPSILVVIPSVDTEQAEKTAQIMSTRAGIPANYLIVPNEEGKDNGFIAKFNRAVQEYPSEYYVYAAEDAFPGRDWLKIAYDTMKKTNSKLLGFSDGKWNGLLASFGMVSSDFRNYNGNIFNPLYQSHFADTELTLIAMQQKVYAYNPASMLCEIDYEKDSKSVNTIDKNIFNQRKLSHFDGLVTDIQLLNQFS